MKLIYSPASPFVRKVMVLLHETGQIDDVETVEVMTTALAPAPEARANNPLAKLPSLVRPDGPTLYDSRVICAFLDDRANAGMYPTGSSRWDTLILEATADGIMEAALLMVYEKRLRPEELWSEDWMNSQWSKVEGALDALNSRWMAHLAGTVDMGHLAVGCALGYLDFRLSDQNWRKGRDALAAWYAEFESRPSMQATRPPEA